MSTEDHQHTVHDKSRLPHPDMSSASQYEKMSRKQALLGLCCLQTSDRIAITTVTGPQSARPTKTNNNFKTSQQTASATHRPWPKSRSTQLQILEVRLNRQRSARSMSGQSDSSGSKHTQHIRPTNPQHQKCSRVSVSSGNNDAPKVSASAPLARPPKRYRESSW
jgi:hypothetical protein